MDKSHKKNNNKCIKSVIRIIVVFGHDSTTLAIEGFLRVVCLTIVWKLPSLVIGSLFPEVFLLFVNNK